MRTVESSRILATSADATPVGALAADPFTGIVIPFVALVGDSPERCLDIVPIAARHRVRGESTRR